MTTTTATPRDAAEGYEMVKDLIWQQVYKFQRAYGGDPEDLFGEAQVAFMRGHRRYEEGVSPRGFVIDHSYSAEIRRWVWYELFDVMRTKARRNTRARMVPIGNRDFGTEPGSPLQDLVDELGEDARYAAGLVLDPPDGLRATAEAKGGTPRNYRSTVRSHLRGEGWGTDRINKAFEEITNALG